MKEEEAFVEVEINFQCAPPWNRNAIVPVPSD